MFKKIATFLLVFMVFTAHASTERKKEYIGVQLGYAKTNYTRSGLGINPIGGLFSTPVELDNDGIGGRVYTGFRMNDYFGGELGYTRYNDVTIRNAFGVPKLNGRIKPQAVDLVALIYLPITNKLDVYTKLGVAYIDVKTNAGIGSVKASSTEHEYRPAYGLGTMYHFADAWSVSLDWTRVHGSGSKLENATLSSVGLNYYFN